MHYVYALFAMSTTAREAVQAMKDALSEEKKVIIEQATFTKKAFRSYNYQGSTYEVSNVAVPEVAIDYWKAELDADGGILLGVWHSDGRQYGEQWELYNATVEDGEPQSPVTERQRIDDEWVQVQVGLEDTYKYRKTGTPVYPLNTTHLIECLPDHFNEAGQALPRLTDIADVLPELPVLFGQGKRT